MQTIAKVLEERGVPAKLLKALNSMGLLGAEVNYGLGSVIVKAAEEMESTPNAFALLIAGVVQRKAQATGFSRREKGSTKEDA